MPTATYATRLAKLATAIAATKILDPAATFVGLIVAPFTPAPDIDPTTITEASYASYARLAVTAWSAPFIDANGRAAVDGGDKLFMLQGGDAPCTIYGWGLWSALTGGTLKLMTEIDTPFPLADVFHGYVADVVVTDND